MQDMAVLKSASFILQESNNIFRQVKITTSLILIQINSTFIWWNPFLTELILKLPH